MNTNKKGWVVDRETSEIEIVQIIGETKVRGKFAIAIIDSRGNERAIVPSISSGFLCRTWDDARASAIKCQENKIETLQAQIDRRNDIINSISQTESGQDAVSAAVIAERKAAWGIEA